MALTDTFVRQVKHNSSTTSNKYADGQDMYLLVSAAGKYWRFDYRFNGKCKTAALGTYPEVSLAKARQRRQEMRELLADSIDPSADKRERRRDMDSLFKAAPKSAQIEVSAQGVYTIPIDVGIKLVRDLFEDIGVDRLRADRYFKNISFDDVSQLDETDLTEAIAVGLDYLTDPGDERSVVKDALLKCLDAQFPSRIGRFVYRVGGSYSKLWPTRHTLAR